MFCLHANMCTAFVFGACEGQRRVPDSLNLELGTVVCGYWEPNPGPLQEQQMLLIASPLFPVFKVCSCIFSEDSAFPMWFLKFWGSDSFSFKWHQTELLPWSLVSGFNKHFAQRQWVRTPHVCVPPSLHFIQWHFKWLDQMPVRITFPLRLLSHLPSWLAWILITHSWPRNWSGWVLSQLLYPPRFYKHPHSYIVAYTWLPSGMTHRSAFMGMPQLPYSVA